MEPIGPAGGRGSILSSSPEPAPTGISSRSAPQGRGGEGCRGSSVPDDTRICGLSQEGVDFY